MADKVEKPKKAKGKQKKDEKGVLAALSSTRPERIGSRRASAPKTFERPAAATPAAAQSTAKPANGKASTAKSATAKTAAAKTAAAKSAIAKAANGKSATAKSATATRRKAAAPRTFEPTEAAESAAGAADERAAGVATPLSRPRPAPEPRPRAVREGAPGIPTSGDRTMRERAQRAPEHARPSGVELVTTAVQAAGELTQIGLTIGGQIIKRAVDRLPKP
jgi:hypothetical protein